VHLPSELAGTKVTITCKTGGLIDNIWLRSKPVGTSISRSYLTTSFENKSISLIISGEGKIPAGGTAVLEIAKKFTDTELLGSWKTSTFKKLDNDSWKVQIKAPWPVKAKVWDLKTPVLYSYRIRLFDNAGKQIDESLPQKFGFRDFRIKGGDFFLNIGGESDEPLDAQTLSLRVAAMVRLHPSQPVYVRGDAQVPYGRVVEAMALVQQAGVPSVGLLTKPADEAK